jgi:hypothetical protein
VGAGCGLKSIGLNFEIYGNCVTWPNNKKVITMDLDSFFQSGERMQTPANTAPTVTTKEEKYLLKELQGLVSFSSHFFSFFIP